MAATAAHAAALILLVCPAQESAPAPGGLFEEFDLPPVTRNQVDDAFRTRFGRPGMPPWARWFSGGGPGQGAGGFDPASLAALMKLFGPMAAGAQSNGAPGLAQWLASLGMGAGGLKIDPSTLSELMSLISRLDSQKDALKAAYPQLDWEKFTELAQKIGSNPGAGDMMALMRFLEVLKAAGGSLGSQDIESIKSLLDRIRSIEGISPIDPSNIKTTDYPGVAGKALNLSLEELGKLGEFLKKLGLNHDQVMQVTSWLKALPAPGLNGNLADWASKVDWSKFTPGKWRDWSPPWVVSTFDWMKPHLGFLKNLPALKIPRIPTASIPTLPSISLGTPAMSRENAMLWMLAVLVPVLAILAYLWRDKLAMLARREPRASAGSLAHVDDIATLVQLFEREALRMLGPSARFRNIRHIEAELSGMFPSAPHREALNTLTGLYERWRYLPVTWHPEPNEVARGRMALEVISAGRPA